MALTVNQQPQDYTPVFNPQIFHATSTNSGAANHSYTFVFTDLITGITGTVQVAKDPVFSAGVFDAMEKSKDFIEYFQPDLASGGWQKATGSIRPFRVNVGETYGSTPVYYPGSDITYYVWSGGVDWMDFANNGFISTPYIYDFGVNKVFMAGVLDDLTFSGKSNFIYILSNHLTGNRPKQITIISYNAAGGVVGSSYIANPHEAGGNTMAKNFVLIDVGDRGLKALTAPQVTGTFPIIGATVTRYEVYNDDVNYSFQGEAHVGGFAQISFTIDPFLANGSKFHYVFNIPGIIGVPASGTATITAVVGGGVYTTNIVSTINAGGIGGGSITLITLIKSIKYGCENIYRPMIVHYLAKNGALQTATFNLMSTKKIKKQNLQYGKDTNFYTGVQYAYDISSRPMRQFGITTQTGLTLRTDWLSDDQVEKYEDLFSSSVIFLDGDENYPNKLIAINCDTQDYVTIPKIKSKLFAWESEFSYAHQNIRQDVRG